MTDALSSVVFLDWGKNMRHYFEAAIEKKIVMLAVEKAREAKPTVQRLYVSAEDDRIAFHIRNGNGFKEVHSIERNINTSRIISNAPEKWINGFNGFPYCVSIKLLEQSQSDDDICFGGMGYGGESLSCPLGGDNGGLAE